MITRTSDNLIPEIAKVAISKIERAIVVVFILVPLSALYYLYLVSEGGITTPAALGSLAELCVYTALALVLAKWKSRVAAWALLILFVLDKIFIIATGNGEPFSLFALLLIIGFAVGIQGTHEYSKLNIKFEVPMKRWITIGLYSLLVFLFVIGSLISAAQPQITQEAVSNSASEESEQTNNAMDTESSEKILTPTELYAVLYDAVVTVHINIGDTEGSQGSGVIFYEDGLIVTNWHVVENIDQATSQYVIDANGSVHTINRVVAYDADLDLAILSITGKRHNTISFANSLDVQIGEKVYTIGSPEGFETTLSDGIISGKRLINGVEIFQTTAPISPGSSGGALINENGKLIGITSAYWQEGQNINFAVPSNNILDLIKKYLDSIETE